MGVIDVVALDEFRGWYDALPEDEAEAVAFVVDLLEQEGLALRFPYSSDVKGSKYPMRELRRKYGNHYFRVLYIFDPKRQAVLILGGDKTGDDRFYKKAIPKAEKLWEAYCAAQGVKP